MVAVSRCRCKPYGKSIGMCRVPAQKFEHGELVECDFFGTWIGGYYVQREWINKRDGEHLIDCRQVGTRIGGHRRPSEVRKLRAGTPWMTTKRAPWKNPSPAGVDGGVR